MGISGTAMETRFAGLTFVVLGALVCLGPGVVLAAEDDLAVTAIDTLNDAALEEARLVDVHSGAKGKNWRSAALEKAKAIAAKLPEGKDTKDYRLQTLRKVMRHMKKQDKDKDKDKDDDEKKDEDEDEKDRKSKKSKKSKKDRKGKKDRKDKKDEDEDEKDTKDKKGKKDRKGK